MLAKHLLTKRSLVNGAQRFGFSSTNNIKHVGVIGAGQMGTGIGIVASRVAGLNVTMIDPYETSLDKSRAFTANWC